MPDGIEKDKLVRFLLHQCGMLYPWQQSYPDLVIDVEVWFSIWKDSFDRIRLALSKEYNPIENYDRHEDRRLARTAHEEGTGQEDIARGRSGSRKVDGTDVVQDGKTETHSGTDKTVGTDHTDTESGSHQEANTDRNISAFNQGTNEATTPRDRQSTTDITESTGAVTGNTSQDFTYGHIVNTDGSRNGRTTEETAESEKENVGSKKSDSRDSQGSDHETLHAHGNIGVTTNQEMIEQETEMRINLNLYQIICRRFSEEFLMEVY